MNLVNGPALHMRVPTVPAVKLRVMSEEGTFDMQKFVTIGYADREGYDRTDPAIREAAHAHDAQMRQSGVLMGIAGRPMQVRNHDAAEVKTTRGPFLLPRCPSPASQ
jgi:hypothetical protein